MIRRVVDFALNNRFLVLGGAILLFAWGIVSFHNLPVEAYPDVANNYVNIITQWPTMSTSLRNGRGIPRKTLSSR
jgi:cobalt-zinc-cadmium resistance protein CzcA